MRILPSLAIIIIICLNYTFVIDLLNGFNKEKNYSISDQGGV